MDLLARLHQRLLAAAETFPGTSLTVGDVYQHLVPYRAVRGELGMWELAQYEHTLLRLLSGEQDYVALDNAEARQELQRELASPNPILGVYRDYADVPLRLAGVAARRAAPLPEPLPEPRPEPLPEPLPSGRGPAAAPAPAPPSARPVAAVPSACRACSAELPGVEGLRYCPGCGADQQEVPCDGCGTRLRAEWNFCIRCGRRRADRAADG